MKKLSLLLFSFLSLNVFSQTLNGPESMEYDDANSRWLISNNGSNQIFARDFAGTLTVFSSALTSGPHGLEIVGDTLYACDGGNLKIFNLSTGATITTINIGGTFLNGITHDNSGNLYITDFSAKNIYRYHIATQQFYLYVSSLAKSPNGIVFDEINSRLVFVNWGSNAPIMAINMSDSTTSTVYPTTLGNCDGITMNCQGQFYVSSWTPNRISRFDNDFVAAPTNMATTGLNSPADIFFAQAIDELGVPNSGNNTIGLHTYASCNSSILENLSQINYFDLISNPGTELIIQLTENGSINGKISVSTVNGKIIHSMIATNDRINLKLPSGIYFVTYEVDGNSQVKKVVIIK